MQASVYISDHNLNKLFQETPCNYSIQDIRPFLRGVLAAPVAEHDPNKWLYLIRGAIETIELDRQLIALKDKLAQEAPKESNNFDDIAKRQTLIRQKLEAHHVDAFLIPRADEYQGEYVPKSAERLRWATGFAGSAGFAIIARDKAAFFTDGRYTLQAQDQVPSEHFDIFSISKDQEPTPTLQPDEWVAQYMSEGEVLAYDPWLHTKAQIATFADAAARANVTLKALDRNLVDLSWANRPAPPISPAIEHSLLYAGIPHQEKRRLVTERIKREKCGAMIITMPEDIAWLLNMRGGDVPCTPLSLCYAIIDKNACVNVYMDKRKLCPLLEEKLSPDVKFHDASCFEARITAHAEKGEAIWVDPATAPIAVSHIIEAADGKIFYASNPCQILKAVKNSVEIQGTINAHIRDAVSLCRYLYDLSQAEFIAKNDEISASDILHDYRRNNEHFAGLSFDTISGAGPNGAVIHYRAEDETKLPMSAGPIYLVDSGGQYFDGTTDVTRSIAAIPDQITDEMRDRYTRVLKGHLNLAMATFPAGTNGVPLDAIARKPLTDVGLNFAHGTGHGVGSYLSVHEGPQGISPRAMTALEPGMIVSNEPGYYENGAYGIRLENLVLVIDTEETDADGTKLYGFKNLTLAPFDKQLIDISLLNDEEIAFLDAYHAEIYAEIGPLMEKVDADCAAWLKESCAALKAS